MLAGHRTNVADDTLKKEGDLVPQNVLPSHFKPKPPHLDLMQLLEPGVHGGVEQLQRGAAAGHGQQRGARHAQRSPALHRVACCEPRL